MLLTVRCCRSQNYARRFEREQRIVSFTARRSSIHQHYTRFLSGRTQSSRANKMASDLLDDLFTVGRAASGLGLPPPSDAAGWFPLLTYPAPSRGSRPSSGEPFDPDAARAHYDLLLEIPGGVPGVYELGVKPRAAPSSTPVTSTYLGVSEDLSRDLTNHASEVQLCLSEWQRSRWYFRQRGYLTRPFYLSAARSMFARGQDVYFRVAPTESLEAARFLEKSASHSANQLVALGPRADELALPPPARSTCRSCARLTLCG